MRQAIERVIQDPAETKLTNPIFIHFRRWFFYFYVCNHICRVCRVCFCCSFRLLLFRVYASEI